MRWHEIAGGIRLPVFKDESEIMDKVQKAGRLPYESLSDDERHIAFDLISRGVLRAVRTKDGKKYYEVVGSEDLWRI